MLPQSVEEFRQRSRRLAWLAFVLGVVSFLMTVGTALFFGPPRSWTSWALPLLITTNAGVFLLPQRFRHPRAIEIYFGVSGAVALVILGAILLQFLKR